MDEYEKKAADFLKATNSTIKIEIPTPEETKKPLWYEKGDAEMQHYRVTLNSARGSWTFDFWDSISAREAVDALDYLKKAQFGDYSQERYKSERILHDKLGRNINAYQARKQYGELRDRLKPSQYAILSCLDLLYSDSFEEFCNEFGYDTDSRKAEKTYNAMLEQDRNLRRLFTLEELEKLEDIN